VVIFRSQILKEARERLESPQVPTSPGHVINRPLSRPSIKMSYRSTKVMNVDDDLAASCSLKVGTLSRLILPQNLFPFFEFVLEILLSRCPIWLISTVLLFWKNWPRCICVTNVGINIHSAFHITDRPLIISASCCVLIKMRIANYLDIHSLKVRFKKGTH
jgi:hypothetical protein